MDITPTSLPDVFVLTPCRFTDDRGFFSESYSACSLLEHGIDTVFVQDNHSVSRDTGTIRGLHFQSPPHAQDKLVRCGKGALLDVAVDIRRGSASYGHWVSVELSFENGKQLWVPAGFAHGFITLQPNTEICYKCSDYYVPDCEGAIAWNDPDLAIAWGNLVNPILSDKDAAALPFAQLDSPFEYQG